MFPFLSLPREIRDTIYRMSLCGVGLMNPHPTSHDSITWRGKNVPSLALLAVNKSIRAEARPVFYLTNLWQIAIEPNEQTLFHKIEPWLFQNLVIVLSGEDGPYLNRMSTASDIYSKSDDELFGLNATLTEDEKREERWRLIHDEYLKDVLLAWDAKVKLLLDDLSYAKTVIVEFHELHCPAGCCRLSVFEEAPIRRLLEGLRREDSAFVHGRPETTFCGLLAEAERILLFEVYGFEKDCDMDYQSDALGTARPENDNDNSDQVEADDDEDGEAEVPDSDDDQNEDADSKTSEEKNGNPIRLLSATDDEHSTLVENDHTESEAPYGFDSEVLQEIVKYDYEVLRNEVRKGSRPNSG